MNTHHILVAAIASCLSLNAVSDTDTDGDGLSDSLENSLGMDYENAMDYYDDTDGDGQYDGDEALAGTNREDPNDAISPLALSVKENGVFTMQLFPSEDYSENYVSRFDYDRHDRLYFSGVLDGEETSAFIVRFDDDLNIDSTFANDGYYFAYELGLGVEFSRSIHFDNNDELIISSSRCTSNECLYAIDEEGQFSQSRFQGETTPGVYNFSSSFDQTHVYLAAQSGNQYIATGYSQADGFSRIFKLDNTDTLDTTFNDGQTYATFDFQSGAGGEYPGALIEMENETVLVAIRQSYKVHLVKIDSDGQPVESFGEQGLITNALGGNYQLSQFKEAQNGQFLVLTRNRTNTGGQSKLFMLNRDGSIDTSFGDNGSVDFIESDIHASPVDVLQQEDGSLIVVLSLYHGEHDEHGIAIYKLTEDGDIETSFHTQGRAQLSVSQYGSASEATLLKDHNILIAGEYIDDTSGKESIYFMVFTNTNDNDHDGVEDEQDAYPNDPTRFEEEEQNSGSNSDQNSDNDAEEEDKTLGELIDERLGAMHLSSLLLLMLLLVRRRH